MLKVQGKKRVANHNFPIYKGEMKEREGHENGIH